MGLGQGERGYAMAALLVGLSVMAVLMSVALPVWTHFVKREKEAELIWRGEQYARAVGLFQRKYANTFPPNVDVLVEQRFLRKKYKDPITNDEFQMIPAGRAAPGSGGGNRSPNQPNDPDQPNLPPGFGGQPPAAPDAPTTLVPPGSNAQGLAGSFQIQGRGPQASIGIQGVVSKSGDDSIKIYNGRTRYNEWAFVYIQTTQRLLPDPGQRPDGRQGRPPVIPPGLPGGPPPPGGSPFGRPQNPPRPPG